MKITEIITEAASARIAHAEDLVFFEGSKGAIRALDALASTATPDKSISIKFDGSPALYFGRLPDGQFVLTDKSGFTAKGYNGLPTTAEDLKNMFLQRGKEVNDARVQFASQMASLWNRFEKTVPKDFRGFVKGDLLYRTQPQVDKNGDYTFTPNVVTYHIKAESDLGKRIAMSTAAIAVHNKTAGPNAPDEHIDLNELNQDTEVMIVGPSYVEHAPRVDTKQVVASKKIVLKYAHDIDSFLDINALSALKLSDLADILYTFVNAMVKSGTLTGLANSFMTWLPNSKISAVKQERIVQYIKENNKGFAAIFSIVELVMRIKDDIIQQLDAADAPIRASINNNPGGEGYVKSHEQGPVKLVNRSGFSAANFAKER